MTNAKELRNMVQETREKREAQERKAILDWLDKTTDEFKTLANHEKTETRITVPSSLKYDLVKKELEDMGFEVYHGYDYREFFVRW